MQTHKALLVNLSKNLHVVSGLLFSHPMLLGIGYRFHGFIDASCHRVLGIRSLIPWFLSYPMPLNIRELVYWQGTGISDHRGLWDIRMVPDFLRALEIRFCQFSVFFSEFVGFRGSFVVS